MADMTKFNQLSEAKQKEQIKLFITTLPKEQQAAATKKLLG